MTEDQRQLVEENIGLVGFVINRFFPNSLGDDDIYQIGCIGLVRSAQHYKEDVSKFSTYASTNIRSEISHHFRDRGWNCRRLNYEAISLETPLTTEGGPVTIGDMVKDTDDFTEDVLSNDFVDEMLKVLNPKEREVVEIKLQGFSDEQIGKMIGRSQPSVSRRIQTAKIKIQAYLDEVLMYDRSVERH